MTTRPDGRDCEHPPYATDRRRREPEPAELRRGAVVVTETFCGVCGEVFTIEGNA